MNGQRFADPAQQALMEHFYRQEQGGGPPPPPAPDDSATPGDPQVPLPEPQPTPPEAPESPSQDPSQEPPGEPGVEEPSEPAEAPTEAPPAEEALPLETLVELPDGEQVSLHELQQSYLRQSDYTRKTQELADQRRTVAERDAAIESEVQKLTGLAQQLEMQAAQYQLSPQQLAQLQQEDPAQWSAYMIQQQQRQSLVAQAQQAAAEAQMQQVQRRIPEEQRRFVEARVADGDTGFRDDFRSAYAKLSEYATSPTGGGLSPDEWSQLYDHRHVNLVAKAMAYDEIKSRTTRRKEKGSLKLAKAPKLVRPGVQSPAQPPPTPSGREAAVARLKRTNSGGRQTLRDVQAAFMDLERSKQERGKRPMRGELE